MSECWFVENGQLKQVAEISTFDRGLQYGDGFFTTALIVNESLLNWPQHYQRLEMSFQRLGFENYSEILQRLLPLIKKAFAEYAERHEASVLKIIVTRGVGGRGYLAPKDVTPTVVLMFAKAPISVSQNLLEMTMGTAQLCQTRFAQSPSLVGLKHLNRLENVLARNELAATAHFEGLVLDVSNHLTCGTQSNVVLVQGSTLLTPKLETAGVNGTALNSLKLLIKDALDWHEARLTLSDVVASDALFFINAVRGCQAVTSLDVQGQILEFSTNQVCALHDAWWQQQLADATCLNG